MNFLGRGPLSQRISTPNSPSIPRAAGDGLARAPSKNGFTYSDDMSGSRTKKQRRAQHERPAYLVNADFALRSADAVLAVDLSEVPLSRVNQFAVGWMRAAFEQSRVIAILTKGDMGHATAPNRRAFWELAVRLLWFAGIARSERERAADTMLAHGRSTEKTTHTHMQSMGIPSDIDIAAMEDFVLDASKEKAISSAPQLTLSTIQIRGFHAESSPFRDHRQLPCRPYHPRPGQSRRPAATLIRSVPPS